MEVKKQKKNSPKQIKNRKPTKKPTLKINSKISQKELNLMEILNVEKKEEQKEEISQEKIIENTKQELNIENKKKTKQKSNKEKTKKEVKNKVDLDLLDLQIENSPIKINNYLSNDNDNLNILVISSCCKKKTVNVDNPITLEDLIDNEKYNEKNNTLSQYKTPAIDLYNGFQHKGVVEGLKNLRQFDCDNKYDFFLISAGYGVLNENDLIVPYDINFRNMKINNILKLGEFLKINENLNLLIKNYDLIFIMLSEEFLKAAKIDELEISSNQKIIFFIPEKSKKLLGNNENIFCIPAGQKEANLLKATSIALKGIMFKKLSEQIIQNNFSIQDIYENPNLIMNIFE